MSFDAFDPGRDMALFGRWKHPNAYDFNWRKDAPLVTGWGVDQYYSIPYSPSLNGMGHFDQLTYCQHRKALLNHAFWVVATVGFGWLLRDLISHH